MDRDRHQSRILAMQALCQWETQRDESLEALRLFLATGDSSPETREYASTLVRGYWSQRELVDQLIAGASESWTLDRISTVERNLLRVGVVEINQGEVPPKVVLNEAVDIAREYAAAESPRFVNGVLDSIYKSTKG